METNRKSVEVTLPDGRKITIAPNFEHRQAAINLIVEGAAIDHGLVIMTMVDTSGSVYDVIGRQLINGVIPIAKIFSKEEIDSLHGVTMEGTLTETPQQCDPRQITAERIAQHMAMMAPKEKSEDELLSEKILN